MRRIAMMKVETREESSTENALQNKKTNQMFYH